MINNTNKYFFILIVSLLTQKLSESKFCFFYISRMTSVTFQLIQNTFCYEFNKDSESLNILIVIYTNPHQIHNFSIK